MSHLMFPKRLARTGALSTRQKRSKLRSGQSLVEWAISLVVLIMLFSGVVDLGRAYFTLVMLNNAISEGAHWAALYPACINSASNSTGGYSQCKGSNSIVGRILNEEQTLDRNSFKFVCWSTLDASGVTGQFYNTNNNTVTLSVTYQATFFTPIITTLFGSTVNLTTEVKEVIRGGLSLTNLPTTPVITSPGAQYQGGVSTATCSPP
ncbi:MAG: TadE/TadG family type IV pilus assembly protein [Aggregatilineales bacterium]